MPSTWRSFMCGTARKSSKKRKKKENSSSQEGEASFRNSVQHRAMESGVMKTLIADNTRLQLENKELRKELEYIRASLMANPRQDDELSRNLSTSGNSSAEERPRSWNDRRLLADTEKEEEEENAILRRRSLRRPSFPLPPLIPEVAEDGEMNEEEIQEDSGLQPEPACRPLTSTMLLAPLAVGHDDQEAINTEAQGSLTGEAEEREDAAGRESDAEKEDSTGSTCPKNVADPAGDECSAPHQETEPPGEELQRRDGVTSPSHLLLGLPDKLTSIFREDLKFVESHFKNEFKSLSEKIRQHGDKTTHLLEKRTGELDSGQRKLLDLAQSTHAGLAALGEALTSARGAPESLPFQADKLPPHLTAIGLDIQDKFITTARVKDFFRLLRMNPGRVEELAARAHSGPSGSRDLFWSMLVAHNGDLSRECGTVNLADVLEACRSLDIPTWQCSVMPREHRRVLERTLVKLVQTLRVDLLLPYLTSAGLMTSPGIKDYVTEGVSAEQVMKLLDILPLAGEHALELLVQALRETDQEHVAEIILGEWDRCAVQVRGAPPTKGGNSGRENSLPRRHGSDVTRRRKVHSVHGDMLQGAGDDQSAINDMVLRTLIEIKCSVKHLESKMK